MTPERWERVKTLFDAAARTPTGNDRPFSPGSAKAIRTCNWRSRRCWTSRSGRLTSSVRWRSGNCICRRRVQRAVASLVGRRIGTFEVLSLLGRGGMGEVYRAHDTKLGRDVAIKVLPLAFTAEPSRVASLEREARVVAP